MQSYLQTVVQSSKQRGHRRFVETATRSTINNDCLLGLLKLLAALLRQVRNHFFGDNPVIYCASVGGSGKPIFAKASGVLWSGNSEVAAVLDKLVVEPMVSQTHERLVSSCLRSTLFCAAAVWK